MYLEDARAVAAVRSLGPLLPKPRRHDLPRTVDELQDRLEAAGGAMLGLVVKGTRPADYRSNMPTPVHDAIEAYGWTPVTEDEMPLPSPSAGQISDMDKAIFGWIGLIPLDPPTRGSGLLHSLHGGAVLRRIVMMRCFVNPRSGRNVFSWRRVAKAVGCSPESARQWHAQGLERILLRLLLGAAA